MPRMVSAWSTPSREPQIAGGCFVGTFAEFRREFIANFQPSRKVMAARAARAA